MKILTLAVNDTLIGIPTQSLISLAMEETTVLGKTPTCTPYAIWARRCCERHSGQVRTLTFTLRASHPAVRARSNTLGVPHQIYAVDSLALAEVAEAAVGGGSAPRSTPRSGMLTGLIPQALSRLSYSYTESVVSDTRYSLICAT